MTSNIERIAVIVFLFGIGKKEIMLKVIHNYIALDSNNPNKKRFECSP